MCVGVNGCFICFCLLFVDVVCVGFYVVVFFVFIW